MDIHEKLKELEKVNMEGNNKVFTMYLNTDPSDPDQQGGQWKIHFKNGMRNFESYLEESNDKEELKNFQMVKNKVKKFIKENELQLLKGIIVFATADEVVWYADKVQMRLEDEFYWQETPELNQFRKLKETYPKTGIILVQQNQIKVIDCNLNHVEKTTSYELDVEEETWRVLHGARQGGAAVGAGSYNNNQKDYFDARYEANQQRWYKSIAPKLDKMVKDHKWKKTYVVGEAPAAKVLTNQMNKEVDDIIPKNMLDHEETKVMQEVLA
ncbi:VLRF1 family aeRF1-type release factor [Oceanobacillus massiliensis]|uniref:VLRF1 family aeRF1-type release factor n=1 Tax=Oceanobacillus massiliensis TaxID=1465765 RepID=UPI00028A0B39|nr:VLRF1 family aeRF1-type release factor [Oceanobacillus massiliensis]